MGILLSYLLPVPKIIEPPPSDPKTYFRWEIPQFRTRRSNSYTKKQFMYSEEFALKTQPSIRLSLYFDATQDAWMENSYGVSMQDFNGNQSIDLSYKIWFEDENKEKFNEQSVIKSVFDEKYRQWGIIGMTVLDSFKDIYDKNGTLYMCCEIVNLNRPRNIYKKFCSNNLSLYEKGIYDTTIFVGTERKEFKALKAFLMAQSPVFETMFQSKFKEAKENEVWIKEIDENTMLGLIKWFYLAEVEEDNGSLENLFEAADKYQIDMLKSECVKYMISTLNDKNMFQRLALAGFYNEPILKAKILDYVKTRPHLDLIELMVSQEWLDFLEEKPYAATEISNLLKIK